MFHQRPSLGGVVDARPYRAATSEMMADPPPCPQNRSAAPSSEDCSMMSSAWRSSALKAALPSAWCSNRSSAMNSFATDAVPTTWPLPLETSWWVRRSRMATDSAAPLAAASSVACWTRACSGADPATGSAWGGWGSCGGVAASSISAADCGGAGAGRCGMTRTGALTGRLYTLA